MTVLMRDELNDADLAWAAADPSVAGVMGQLQRARQAMGLEPSEHDIRTLPRVAVAPELLRARGAL